MPKTLSIQIANNWQTQGLNKTCKDLLFRGNPSKQTSTTEERNRKDFRSHPSIVIVVGRQVLKSDMFRWKWYGIRAGVSTALSVELNWVLQTSSTAAATTKTTTPTVIRVWGHLTKIGGWKGVVVLENSHTHKHTQTNGFANIQTFCQQTKETNYSIMKEPNPCVPLLFENVIKWVFTSAVPGRFALTTRRQVTVGNTAS